MFVMQPFSKFNIFRFF